MKFLNKMERRFGKYAIRNLSIFIAACFVVSYILAFLAPGVYSALIFSPYDVFVKHQIWRLFTWIFTMPGGFDIFTPIMIFFYYIIGTSIERGIGTFYYNLYIFGSLAMITVGQAVVWLFIYITKGDAGVLMNTLVSDGLAGASLMTYYLTTSIFLGYALLYQDAMMLLFFVIPFKVKWFAYIDGVYLLYYFIEVKGIASRVTILAIALNFLIYYLFIRRASGKRRPTAQQLKRRKAFNDSMKNAGKSSTGKVVSFETRKAKDVTGTPNPEGITRHKCAICGRTEKDDPNLEFRYCSKCNGNYEYCQDHLYTHEHVK